MEVVYFRQYPAWPEQFHCPHLLADLTRRGCADLFTRSANLCCNGCPTGKLHAGAPRPEPYHPSSQLDPCSTGPVWRHMVGRPCVRCERSTFRIIGPGLCVSCLNRQYEIISGRNGKGQPPILVIKQVSRFVLLIAGDIDKRAGKSGCNPTVLPISGGALVEMISSGIDECRRWLALRHPGATVVDHEQHALSPAPREGRDDILANSKHRSINPIIPPIKPTYEHRQEVHARQGIEHNQGILQHRATPDAERELSNAHSNGKQSVKPGYTAKSWPGSQHQPAGRPGRRPTLGASQGSRI